MSGLITIDSTSLLRGGAPWFPVSGEYHFSRGRPENWERELRKMKAGGLGLVASYLIWNIHEPVRGARRWDGECDFRRFVQLAGKVGLDVVARIGPWSHAEARFGGFPDWLQELPIGLRTDDPAYLEIVEDWYADVARQLDGLVRDADHPDAPVVSFQVENELYDQPGHLATLRALAEQHGLSSGVWTATGWGGAQLPLDVVVPVYAGYPEGFWEPAEVEWPEFGEMHFRFSEVRDDLSVGADLRGGEVLAPVAEEDRRHPFLTCELGAGMNVSYHRRPHVDPADVAAISIAKLGSGSVWQGWYIYCGGNQARGLHESHESGYPNDVPLLDYDYFSPIGPAGTLRPHYHLLRRQHLFLQRWGHDLATMPASIGPIATVRSAVRSRDGRGYLFVNNHQPAVRALPVADGVQLDLALDGHRVVVPSAPATVGSGTFFIWPLRCSYGEIGALTGTVQPITQIDTPDGPVAIVAETPGIAVELDLELADDQQVLGATARETPAGTRWVPELPPGPDCVVTVGSTRLVILDDACANRLWQVRVGGREHLLLWDGGLFVADDEVVIERWTDATEVFSLPALGDAMPQTNGPFARTVLGAHEPRQALEVRMIAEATGAAPTRRGGSQHWLSAPIDEDFAMAAVVEIDVHVPSDEPNAVLEIDWDGDVARAYVGDRLVSDQFWAGRPWELDVDAWRHDLAEQPLRIEILPWNGEADYFVDPRVRHRRVPGVAAVHSAALVLAAQVRIAADPA
ncbi:MAG: beta-galactosidase [Actinomycetales bacterium]|uniref:Beta-galactosidase n=1 Tax=Candidatus Phosphoribacter hodrii TaxID=2953743 RepID=A0A935ISC5_9MICO|nr:beta-galactosidase [Candidatus Phosphoribacter hodrii]